MTLSRGLALAALAAVSLALNACGGGGNSLAGGGVSGTGITSGSITGFGSIIANERVHNTDQAVFERDGQSATQADFKIGDVVVIEWDSSDGGVTRNATRVSYQRQLFGEVTADPDPVTNGFGVLGQTVRANATTIFDNFDPIPVGAVFPPNLVQGVCVEVTGFRDASGDLFATRIEFQGLACSQPVELTGIISSLPSSNTIVVSGTTVNIAGATITGGPLAVDQWVEVAGSFSGSVLNATTVEVRDEDLSELEDDDLDVEGIINGLAGTAPNATFFVSGIPVATNSQTVYAGGNFSNLANNVRVEVEGGFTGGQLTAEIIKFNVGGSVQIETVVLSADGQTGAVTVRLGMDSLTVLTNPLVTQLKDDTGTYNPFGVGDLMAEDFVNIVGYVDGADIIATKLELDDLAPPSSNERELQGPVTNLDGSSASIEVLGVSINITPQTECEGASSCSDFVSSLTLGDIVQAQGREISGVIEWTELEREDN